MGENLAEATAGLGAMQTSVRLVKHVSIPHVSKSHVRLLKHVLESMTGHMSKAAAEDARAIVAVVELRARPHAGHVPVAPAKE